MNDTLQLYVYPIKSLRPTHLSHAVLTEQGFPYDRCFMLLQVKEGKGEEAAEEKKPILKNMHISGFHEMALFHTDLNLERGQVIVKYVHPHTDKATIDIEGNNDEKNGDDILHIPLSPSTEGLGELDINMHRSPTKAYNMGPEFNEWFSKRFGFPVILVYLGENTRPVLGSLSPSLQDDSRSLVSSLLLLSSLVITVMVVVLSSWFLRILLLALVSLVWQKHGNAGGGGKGISSLIHQLLNKVVNGKGKGERARITFADCAAYLVASETSLHDVTARLRADGGNNVKSKQTEEDIEEEEEEMEMTKFRPNIVVSGASTAYEEDFWSELTVRHSEKDGSSNSSHLSSSSRIILTANCVRCNSINVDFKTGKPGKGPKGSVLKKLMKDRRVDKGAPYSPVFGRYGFWAPSKGKGKRTDSAAPHVIRIGDQVSVSKVTAERSILGVSLFHFSRSLSLALSELRSSADRQIQTGHFDCRPAMACFH